MVAVVPPFIFSASSLPVTVGPNLVSNWSTYNYEGYENQPSYPEFKSLMQTMAAMGKRYGCGRAMWEYSSSENRFGTPEALMLLPYETNGCIDSMEGLLFESSATTPYHFLNQAELSAGPSEPEVGLPYGSLNVTLGVQHLQLLGVKYFIAETPQVEQEAAVDPSLQLVAKTGPWTYNYSGTNTTTTWNIYLVKDSPLVTPLANDPVVLSGVKPDPASWLGTSSLNKPANGPAVSWYADPKKWNVELAQSGPADWPRTSVNDIQPTVKHVGTTKVTNVTQGDSSVSFHVSRVGTPVLVKVSYFPNWHASGADGPWRVTPNLMVVVPTSHDVTLTLRSLDRELSRHLCHSARVDRADLALRRAFLAAPAAAAGGYDVNCSVTPFPAGVSPTPTHSVAEGHATLLTERDATRHGLGSPGRPSICRRQGEPAPHGLTGLGGVTRDGRQRTLGRRRWRHIPRGAPVDCGQDRGLE